MHAIATAMRAKPRPSGALLLASVRLFIGVGDILLLGDPKPHAPAASPGGTHSTHTLHSPPDGDRDVPEPDDDGHTRSACNQTVIGWHQCKHTDSATQRSPKRRALRSCCRSCIRSRSGLCRSRRACARCLGRRGADRRGRTWAVVLSVQKTEGVRLRRSPTPFHVYGTYVNSMAIPLLL